MARSIGNISRRKARRLYDRMMFTYDRVRKAVRTTRLKWQGKPDIERWTDDAHLSQSWDTRTAMLAEFIAPNSSVLEFGAARLVLPQYLPDGCTYTPSDLTDRGQGTIVCDLNARPLPDFPNHDVAVFSGVLEYVKDIDSLLHHLRDRCPTIVASYAVTDHEEVSSKIYRRSAGWLNDHSASDFVRVFAAHGYAPTARKTWEGQLLLKFVRR